MAVAVEARDQDRDRGRGMFHMAMGIAIAMGSRLVVMAMGMAWGWIGSVPVPVPVPGQVWVQGDIQPRSRKGCVQIEFIRIRKDRVQIIQDLIHTEPPSRPRPLHLRLRLRLPVPLPRSRLLPGRPPGFITSRRTTRIRPITSTKRECASMKHECVRST